MNYISHKDLARMILANEDIAVIDVRDEDFIGGNIVKARNIPSKEIHLRSNELLGLPPVVVFHCALSQVRGPKAAQFFMKNMASSSQKVYVLRGGFSNWAAVHGKNTKLTENFCPDLYK